MGKHTVISDIGNALVTILREGLVPQTIQNADGIALCSPADRGEAVLCVHLYDVRESAEVRAVDMVNLGTGLQRYPSTYLSLSYMLTAFSTAETQFRSAEEHRIIGRALQTLADNSILSQETLRPQERAGREGVRIQLLSLETEEKLRLWNFPNIPYRLSLFYQITPVELESDRTRTVQRVVDADLTIKEHGYDDTTR